MKCAKQVGVGSVPIYLHLGLRTSIKNGKCLYPSPFFPGFIGGIAPLKIQSNWVIIPSKGPNKPCRYKRSVVVSELFGKSAGKILQDKTQACRYVS